MKIAFTFYIGSVLLWRDHPLATEPIRLLVHLRKHNHFVVRIRMIHLVDYRFNRYVSIYKFHETTNLKTE